MTINLPGHPIPVPLAALQAAGYMLPSSGAQQRAPAAAAADSTAATEEGDAGSLLSDPRSLCTEGRVNDGSRRAAMACGISAAAAGSGAVADLPLRAAAVAGGVAVAAVAKQAVRNGKAAASSKSLQLVQAAAHAAATAAVQALSLIHISQGIVR